VLILISTILTPVLMPVPVIILQPEAILISQTRPTSALTGINVQAAGYLNYTLGKTIAVFRVRLYFQSYNLPIIAQAGIILFYLHLTFLPPKISGWAFGNILLHKLLEWIRLMRAAQWLIGAMAGKSFKGEIWHIGSPIV